MLKARCICILLPMFTACTRQAQNQHPEEVTQPQISELRIVSLEHDVQRLKSEIVRLEAQHYIDTEIQFVLNPSRDCGFVVSQWSQTQETLNGFVDDSAAMRRRFGDNGPDPRIQGGIKGLVTVINKTCKSNLVFNAKSQ